MGSLGEFHQNHIPASEMGTPHPDAQIHSPLQPRVVPPAQGTATGREAPEAAGPATPAVIAHRPPLFWMCFPASKCVVPLFLLWKKSALSTPVFWTLCIGVMAVRDHDQYFALLFLDNKSGKISNRKRERPSCSQPIGSLLCHLHVT